MRNNEFKNFMNRVNKATTKAELETMACDGYLLLDMTARQIQKLAQALIGKGYPIINGKLTPQHPEPHKAVQFGIFQLALD